MQPDNQPQQPQFSSDYLNQIAAPAQVKTLSPFVLWGIIAGALILIVTIVIFISSASGSGTSTSSLSSVAAKIAGLKVLTETEQDNIQSTELRTLGSSLTLTLTNANRDLEEPLKTNKISLKSKKVPAINAVNKDLEEMTGRLEDARLNAVFDRTYAREMTFALKTLRSDMSTLYKNTKSKKLKTALETADANIKPISEEFASFNAS